MKVLINLIPRGSAYSTMMELGPKRLSLLRFQGPNFIMVLYVEPLGIGIYLGSWYLLGSGPWPPKENPLVSMGFRARGIGFKVRVLGLGFGISGLGFGGLRFRVLGLGFGI